MEGLYKSGDVFPLELYISQTTLGKKQLFIGSVRNIAHRKKLEHLRNEFIATVSHELRTPLAATMGWIETVLSERPGPLTDGQRRFLGIAYSSAERLNKLVEEILTVSRLQRGALQLDIRPFAPFRTLATIIESIQSVAMSRRIELLVDNAWPADETLLGDEARLEQVLNNLLSNAIKFSPDDATVHVSAVQSSAGWEVTIRDHGIGIPQAEQSRLFTRFFRASTATEAEVQGSGLGLYVCKAIVEGHGGQIELTSAPHVGTTVRFVIPWEHRRPEAPTPA